RYTNIATGFWPVVVPTAAGRKWLWTRSAGSVFGRGRSTRSLLEQTIVQCSEGSRVGAVAEEISVASAAGQPRTDRAGDVRQREPPSGGAREGLGEAAATDADGGG